MVQIKTRKIPITAHKRHIESDFKYLLQQKLHTLRIRQSTLTSFNDFHLLFFLAFYLMKIVSYILAFAALSFWMVSCSGAKGKIKEVFFEMSPVEYALVKDSIGRNSQLAFGRGDIRDTIDLDVSYPVSIMDTGDITGDGFPEFVISTVDSVWINSWIDQRGSWCITETYTNAEVTDVLLNNVLISFRNRYSKHLSGDGLPFLLGDLRSEYLPDRKPSNFYDYKVHLQEGKIIIDSLQVVRTDVKPDYEEGVYELRDGNLMKVAK